MEGMVSSSMNSDDVGDAAGILTVVLLERSSSRLGKERGGGY